MGMRSGGGLTIDLPPRKIVAHFFGSRIGDQSAVERRKRAQRLAGKVSVPVVDVSSREHRHDVCCDLAVECMASISHGVNFYSTPM